MRRKEYDNWKWDNIPLKITYADLRKIQQRAYNAGYKMGEFTYRDREYKAPETFEEWFDIQSGAIGGYMNDSQELEILPDDPPPMEYDPNLDKEIPRGMSW